MHFNIMVVFRMVAENEKRKRKKGGRAARLAVKPMTEDVIKQMSMEHGLIQQ